MLTEFLEVQDVWVAHFNVGKLHCLYFTVFPLSLTWLKVIAGALLLAHAWRGRSRLSQSAGRPAAAKVPSKETAACKELHETKGTNIPNISCANIF